MQFEKICYTSFSVIISLRVNMNSDLVIMELSKGQGGGGGGGVATFCQ